MREDPKLQKTTVNQANEGQYLTFLLNGEEYGVDILRVEEIRHWEPMTPLPDAPPHLLGVLNLRGRAVPVFDLRRRFGFAALERGATTVIIVLEAQASDGMAHTVGFVVDAVSDVHQIALDTLQPAPGVGGATRANFIQGLTLVKGRMIILLNVDRLAGEEADVAAMTMPHPGISVEQAHSAV